MTAPAQIAALSASAVRTVYFGEFHFKSATLYLSSWNAPFTWGGQQFLSLPAIASNYAGTPDSVASSITGDIDLRVQLSATDWTPATESWIYSKWASAPQLSYGLTLKPAGTLAFYTSPDGTTTRTNTSTVAPFFVDGSVQWVRATKSASTGIVTFYVSTDGILWTQLGATVAGTIESIFNGTTQSAIGSDGSGTGGGFVNLLGAVYYADVRNSIGGSAVVSMNAQDALIGASSFVSSLTGETWTVNTSGITPAAIAGGNTWIGLGTMGSMSNIEESASLDAQGITFTLSLVDASMRAISLGDVNDYRGQAAKVYGCPLDATGQLVGTPELCWRGTMDVMSMGVDKDEGAIQLKCETSAFGLKRVASQRMNAAQQKRRFPADTGFDYLNSIISQPQLWLSKRFQSQ